MGLKKSTKTKCIVQFLRDKHHTLTNDCDYSKPDFTFKERAMINYEP